jgi:polysaccharide biosynthesis protein PslG
MPVQPGRLSRHCLTVAVLMVTLTMAFAGSASAKTGARAHASNRMYRLENSHPPASPSLAFINVSQLRGADLHPMASDESASVIQREFSLLQSAGATSVRFDVFWTAVEWTAKGDYDPNTLAWLDWVFAQAHAHGLKVVLDVWSTPCWASSAPVTMKLGCGAGWWNFPVRYYPPANAQDYADFCAFAAKRWGYALAALELWNEPNGNFLYASNKAAAYARLVTAAYPAVKAVAPRLPVIMSLAGTDTRFLSQLYADGVKGHYDGIAVHPYGQPQLDGLKAFRAYQLSQGDSVPLWVTEIGWSTSVPSPQSQGWGVASALRQLAALPYVADVDVYEMRDEGSDLTNPQDHFGLVNQNLTPKAGWNAFAATTHALDQRAQLARQANRRAAHRPHRG